MKEMRVEAEVKEEEGNLEVGICKIKIKAKE